MHLTRKRIIDAAMDMIERDGIEAISMRRLATELGCGVMSLYNHVPSKSALLGGVADAVMSGIDMPSVSAGDWPELIRTQARAFRQVARSHPRCAMLVVSRPPSASVVRLAEDALAALRDAGFGGQDAVQIVRAVSALIMGSLLGEIGIAPGLADADDAETHRLRLRPGEFPHLTALAAELSASSPDTDFEFGLDLLLRAAAAMQPARMAR
jgi:AcrR family transcriptional regulator